jgi:hypothetical protein
MVLSPPLLKVLGYFSGYSYPLTAAEIWFWQEKNSYSLAQIRKLLASQKYYYLPGHESDVKLRLDRQKISTKKLRIANHIINHLTNFPFISAIFITGALSMMNSPENDDIDIMVVTRPHTLWITRLLVILFLKLQGRRRPTSLSEHASLRVSNTICDNLWLDTQNLNLTNRSLFTAHELLQAKCVFDCGGIHRKILLDNSWAGDYLPIAYQESLKKLNPQKNHEVKLVFLWPINALFFTLQYLYMLPKITNEQIGLGFAFFHPRSPKTDKL